MMATAARRVGFAPVSRGINAVAALSGSRPSAAPVVASVAPAASSSWGASRGTGYATNVFSRHVVKAVAEPEAGEAEAEPIKLLTSDESEELLKIRHTTAHICAMATQKLFPDAKCTIGPWCATHPVDPPFATPIFLHRRRGRRPGANRAHPS